MPSPGQITIASELAIPIPINTITLTGASSGGSLLEGSTYRYTISALNGTEIIKEFPVDSITLGTGEDSVDIKWYAITGADSYNVYGRNPTGDLVLLQSGMTTTSYTDTGSAAEDPNTISSSTEQPITVQMSESGATVQGTSTDMHNGWTCSTPTTPSTFESEFTNGYVSTFTNLGFGKDYIICIGTALDTEVDSWVASWDGSIHSYTPTVESIMSTFDGCTQIRSNAAIYFAEKIATIFITYFEQEVG